MPFFENCTDFEITGGVFNDVKGNLNVFRTTSNRATTSSHNFGTGGGANGNPGRRYTQFPQAASNVYRHPQDMPGRSQSQSSAFPAVNPRVEFNPSRQNSGWSGDPQRTLPDPHTSYPEHEIAAQIHRDAARPRFTVPRESSSSAPPSSSGFNSRTNLGASPWPTAHTAPPTRPIPMAAQRPGKPSRQMSQASREGFLSSSPEDTDASSWSSPSRVPRAADPSFWPGQATPRARSDNLIPRTSRDDDGESSSSESEDEDSRPAARSQSDQNSGRGDSEWRF